MQKNKNFKDFDEKIKKQKFKVESKTFNESKNKKNFIENRLTRSSSRQHKSHIAPSGTSIDFINKTQLVNNKDLLNIWVKSEPFFGHFPTDNEIESLLNIKKINLYETKKKADWIDLCFKFIESIPKENNNLQLPFSKTSHPLSYSSYWSTNSVFFPIEDLQKRNRTPLHTLISSLIDENNLIEEEIIDNENEINLIHSIPSKIGINNYLSLPFEERLQNELNFAGIIDDGLEFKNEENNNFYSESILINNELKKIEPIINNFKNNFNEKINNIKIDLQKREEEENLYKKLLKNKIKIKK